MFENFRSLGKDRREEDKRIRREEVGRASGTFLNSAKRATSAYLLRFFASSVLFFQGLWQFKTIS
ncbi:MAG: hypothetical protein NT166_32235 [Candidatus Aminicenantes bacterium]|nr:hypothetical protein [Candidatus Aminicenantes bacterium]